MVQVVLNLTKNFFEIEKEQNEVSSDKKMTPQL